MTAVCFQPQLTATITAGLRELLANRPSTNRGTRLQSGGGPASVAREEDEDGDER